MASFTNGERREATEKDLKAPWGGYKDGRKFRCGMCGHKFIFGDGWRWLYTNDLKGSGGNPLICDSCFTTKEDTRRRWIIKCEEWKAIKENFWHFLPDDEWR